jgi:hypothetical protein
MIDECQGLIWVKFPCPGNTVAISYRGAPELRFFRVPVPAGTNKKTVAGTGTLSFSERQNIKFIY